MFSKASSIFNDVTSEDSAKGIFSNDESILLDSLFSDERILEDQSYNYVDFPVLIKIQITTSENLLNVLNSAEFEGGISTDLEVVLEEFFKLANVEWITVSHFDSSAEKTNDSYLLTVSILKLPLLTIEEISTQLKSFLSKPVTEEILSTGHSILGIINDGINAYGSAYPETTYPEISSTSVTILFIEIDGTKFYPLTKSPTKRPTKSPATAANGCSNTQTPSFFSWFPTMVFVLLTSYAT
jgi:hypothetical protein